MLISNCLKLSMCTHDHLGRVVVAPFHLGPPPLTHTRTRSQIPPLPLPFLSLFSAFLWRFAASSCSRNIVHMIYLVQAISMKWEAKREASPPAILVRYLLTFFCVCYSIFHSYDRTQIKSVRSYVSLLRATTLSPLYSPL